MSDLFEAESTPILDGPTLDEFIVRLQELRTTVGGQVKVCKWSVSKGPRSIRTPEIAYLMKTGHSRFWNSAYDPVEAVGVLVIRV